MWARIEGLHHRSELDSRAGCRRTLTQAWAGHYVIKLSVNQ
jgi:hypothetical protein